MEHLITILGPTATGKTTLAAGLANLIGGEIISADSRQVYKGMDIGTGKDITEYHVAGNAIPYHLIDIVEPGYKYNVFEFMVDFTKAFNKISDNGNIPILCGGTGMYLDSILRKYHMSEVPQNKELRFELENHSLEKLRIRLLTYGPLHNTSDITDRERTIRAIEIAEFEKKNQNKIELPKFKSANFGIHMDRQVVRDRISLRLEQRLEEGMIEEAKQLLENNVSEEDLMYYGLEYKFLTMYITKKISYNEMFSNLETAIHQFAKRQMTWFRKMEKNGIKINWIDGNLELNDKLALILKLLKV